MLFLLATVENRFQQRESGGIGRRARLRIWYRKVWGFESPLSHQEVLTDRLTLPQTNQHQILNVSDYFITILFYTWTIEEKYERITSVILKDATPDEDCFRG